MFLPWLIGSITRLKFKFPSNPSSSRLKNNHPSLTGEGGKDLKCSQPTFWTVSVLTPSLVALPASLLLHQLF